MVGVFELFKIGIGPSSSHTVGPMKAALAFAQGLAETGLLDDTANVTVDLYGSLAWTGRGHGTDKAVILGLAGFDPATVDPSAADRVMAESLASCRLAILGRVTVDFDPKAAIRFDVVTTPSRHPNTLRFTANDGAGDILAEETWCSVGGGFICRESEADTIDASEEPVPYPFRNADELLRVSSQAHLTIAALVEANERARHAPAEVDSHVAQVIGTMMACIDRGLETDGTLPGGLHVKRRARSILEKLQLREGSNARPAHEIMDYVSLYAMAVNEENAAGGRVVTAPTNGAAGVIPAVLRYYRDHCFGATPEGMRSFILTATAVGALFKMNASISGAEVGCQGEVGVACSMAAAGLCAALGGSNAQIENAAEIGMEHHLGMTCDPVGGLVQIPCIERNAFGAVKAINAASLALHGDGTHKISLDHVIATMRQTGADMSAKYKETSLGGLAVNFIEC